MSTSTCWRRSWRSWRSRPYSINLGAAESLYDVMFDSGGRWILLSAVHGRQLARHQCRPTSSTRRGSTRASSAVAAAEAVIFAPFLHYIFEVQGDGTTTVLAAAAITGLGFAGLTPSHW